MFIHVSCRPVTRLLCSCAPGYTLLYHTILICQVAAHSAVSWCVVSCRDVSGRVCGGVEKAFSFYYIMWLVKCQVFSENFAREMKN